MTYATSKTEESDTPALFLGSLPVIKSGIINFANDNTIIDTKSSLYYNYLNIKQPQYHPRFILNHYQSLYRSSISFANISAPMNALGPEFINLTILELSIH